MSCLMPIFIIMIHISKTNEQLKCYKFPEGDMAYDSIHKLLMALSQYGLKDDLLVQTLCEPVSYTHLQLRNVAPR